MNKQEIIEKLKNIKGQISMINILSDNRGEERFDRCIAKIIENVEEIEQYLNNSKDIK